VDIEDSEEELDSIKRYKLIPDSFYNIVQGLLDDKYLSKVDSHKADEKV
jgi:hypothetical protein